MTEHRCCAIRTSQMPEHPIDVQYRRKTTSGRISIGFAIGGRIIEIPSLELWEMATPSSLKLTEIDLV